MKCKMQAAHVTSLDCHHRHHAFSRRLLPPWPAPSPTRITNPRPKSRPWSPTTRSTTAMSSCTHFLRENSSGRDEDVVGAAAGDDEVETEIDEIGKNSRRIRAKITINASLLAVWNILTDYERLAEFIPGLAVSQLLQKTENYARLFQIGQQKLAFGINFNAKGILDCYEKDLETLPFGQRRDIEFKMIEGDFQLFEGKWSIEQFNVKRSEVGNSLAAEELYTILSYVVDVEPKLWLPVGLVQGRLCREIKVNLSCIREEVQRRS